MPRAIPTGRPDTLALGATASSEGTQPVCRFPSAALALLTSGVSPKRPAALDPAANNRTCTRQSANASRPNGMHGTVRCP